MHRRTTLATILATLVLATAALADTTSDPGKIVTQQDVEKVLGGKFTARSPEPGVLFYEETDSGYRQVNVYLWPAEGKTVGDMMAHLTSQGEPVEEVPGIEDAAMFRPQSNEATVEKKDKSGEVQWLSITVHNVDKPEDAKRFAIELAKRGSGRL